MRLDSVFSLLSGDGRINPVKKETEVLNLETLLYAHLNYRSCNNFSQLYS